MAIQGTELFFCGSLNWWMPCHLDCAALRGGNHVLSPGSRASNSPTAGTECCGSCRRSALVLLSGEHICGDGCLRGMLHHVHRRPKPKRAVAVGFGIVLVVLLYVSTRERQALRPALLYEGLAGSAWWAWICCDNPILTTVHCAGGVLWALLGPVVYGVDCMRVWDDDAQPVQPSGTSTIWN